MHAPHARKTGGDHVNQKQGDCCSLLAAEGKRISAVMAAGKAPESAPSLYMQGKKYDQIECSNSENFMNYHIYTIIKSQVEREYLPSMQ